MSPSSAAHPTAGEVAEATGRSRSTAAEYLCRYILQYRPADIDAWVAPETYAQVAAAARELGVQRLKPLFERLGGRIPYEAIKAVLAHLEARGEPLGA